MVNAELNSVDCGPVSLTRASWGQAMEWLGCCLQEREAVHYACFCEANLLSCAIDDEKLQGVLARADAVFADGVVAMKLAKVHGHLLPERIPGPTFLLKACEAGLKAGWLHYFYGGDEGVADKLAEILKVRFSGLQVSGTYSPPFREIGDLAEDDDVLHRIEDAGTDILWVGLGGPKQEFWMAEHQKRLSVPIMLGVGAAFDFHSGRRRWAPRWIRAIGLEWLFRMLTGGRATFVRNVRCLRRVALLLLKSQLNARFRLTFWR